jgi:hypothetical protein
VPLDPSKINAICDHLARIAKGEKPPLLEIGELTDFQFTYIREERATHLLPILESPVVVYSGRHHYNSRSKDGYTIEDMVLQLKSGLGAECTPIVISRSTILKNKQGRNDGYGNMVYDEVVLELMARKPRAEAYSAIPKGDNGGPKKAKAPG